MRYTQNINLPIVEDNDLYSKEINNLAFEKIDEEIQGLVDIVETIDSPENSIADIKSDIRDINEQLDNIAKLVLIEDVDGTDYKKGQKIDVDDIIRLQAINYSYLMRKLKKNESEPNEVVNIICRGDSLTYGYDVNSTDKRPSVNKPNDKGIAQTTTIASTTYPEALLQAMEKFNKSVTIENIGISGTTCEGSFNDYYKARTNSLELIMLGTNDSRNTNYPYFGDIERFINYYEQLIIRSTLWGNAIIMIQPPSNQYMRDLNIETYRVAIKKLADKYGITLLDASEMTTGMDHTHWSDATHFTGKGYRYLAYSIANAICIQDSNQPLLINSGSVLMTRPTEDSCIFLGDCRYSMSATGYTPYSFISNNVPKRGVGIFFGDGKIIYTFKTTEDNLVVLPTVYCQSDCGFKVTLDHGLEQTCTPLSTSSYQFTDFDNRRSSQMILDYVGRNSKYDYRNKKKFNEMLIINHKGWHSLTFEPINPSVLTDTSFNVVYGIEFASMEDWHNMTKYNRYDTLYHSSQEIGTPTPTGTKITLSNNISDYNYLIVSYNCLGVENRIVDFSINTTQNIRSFNISNAVGQFDMAFNELTLEKETENTILISSNKSVTLRHDSNGSNLTLSETGAEKLSEIRTVKGVKV